MRRRLSTFLAVLLTALAAVAVVLWVRSRWVVDKVTYWPAVSQPRSTTYLFSCEPGRLSFVRQSYEFPVAKLDEFIATKREQHEASEGFRWRPTHLADMRPEVASAYRRGFTIASDRFQPYPIQWDAGEMPKTWGIEGIRYRWLVIAVPHWLVVLALLAFPVLFVAARVRRRARHRRHEGEGSKAAVGSAGADGGPAAA